MPENTQELLESRNEKYKNSFYATDRAINSMIEGNSANLQNLVNAGLLGNWIIMMSKMNRAIWSPLERDHWEDIAGYANLQLRIIDKDFDVYNRRDYINKKEENPYIIEEPMKQMSFIDMLDAQNI